MTDAQEQAVEKAEKAIQKILIDLENDNNVEIESVDVDTRNFSNLRTEIFVTEHQSRF